jgi:toxin HigB-1
VIKSFRSKRLRQFVQNGETRQLSVQNPRRIARILLQLDEAERPEDMNVPGYRFHALRGDQKGRYAVEASGNWRITFGWDGENAIDVDLEDYH